MAASRLEELFRRVAEEGPAPLDIRALRLLARGASWLYGLGAAAAALADDLTPGRAARLPVPVIGVGNLLVGGTGKTPLVIAVVEALGRLGLPSGVLSRGYGGSAGPGVRVVSVGKGPVMGAAQAGDEPVLLARRLPVPVAVGADRYTAGRVLLAACGPRVLVGDDLFQHRRLYRDLNLLALPADRHPLRERLLPRGRLREPLAGMRRAGAVVLTHAEDPARVAELRGFLRTYWGPGPVLACRHRLAGFVAAEGRPVPPDKCREAAVLAFCGLARPEAFRRELVRAGLVVRELAAFGDHHRFTAGELADLARRAGNLGCQALVTSEKDLARLDGAILPADPPLWVARLELVFDGGPAALDGLLAWGLAEGRARS